jgi:hypothetical protein
MEMKIIEVNNVEYEFFFDEDLNMWRITDNPNFIEGFSIDMEIELSNFVGGIEWQKTVKFIELLRTNNPLFIERVNDAKIVLKSLFATINKKTYDVNFLNHIEFYLSGIDFKGTCKIANLEEKFEYDCFFFPQYATDPYHDIGSFVWRANFRDTLLLGVYCDRI